MIYEVEFTKEAELDIRGIFEYIAFNLHSFDIAQEQINRLEESILSLDQMPERFRRYDSEPWNSRNLRVMPIDNYVVLYIPDIENTVVRIMRIMYMGRDINYQLNNTKW